MSGNKLLTLIVGAVVLIGAFFAAGGGDALRGVTYDESDLVGDVYNGRTHTLMLQEGELVGPIDTTAAADFDSTAIFGGLITLNAGVLHSYNNSTSTPASLTLAASDILNYESVTMKPTVGAITVTFPASSTLSALVPNAGDRVKQCWYNATTTAASTITFAAGTGLDLEIASTTVLTGATSLILGADNSACFEFQRKGSGPNASDIVLRFLRFSDGD